MRCQRPPVRVCPDTKPGTRYPVLGPLFHMVSEKIRTLLPDKGYDAHAIREELSKAAIEAVTQLRVIAEIPLRTIAENINCEISLSAYSTS